MKKTKRVLSLALALLMVLSLLPVTAFAVGPQKIGDSNVTWELSGGTLTIGGTGDMPDFLLNVFDCPWWGASQGDITNIVINSGVTSIGDRAFYSTSIESVVIPEGVTRIGVEAFEGCYSLESVVMPNGVESIGDRAFLNCEMLAEAPLPESLKSIGNSAFECCYALESVTLPEGLVSIGSCAFLGCGINQPTLVIPESVETIGQGVFSCDFESVTFLGQPKSIGGNSEHEGAFIDLEIQYLYLPETWVGEPEEGEYRWWQDCTFYNVFKKHVHDGITFEPWTEEDSLPAEGNYYLIKDVMLYDTHTVTGTLNLCLNDKVVNLNGKGNITVSKGAKFNIYDCGEGTTRYYDKNATTGLWTLNTALTSGDYTTTGGVITGGNAAQYGGGVYTASGGSFTMSGGNIVGNAAGQYGGGVFVYGDSFTMNGGSITGNKAQRGGGVYMYSGTFTMKKGKISGNAAQNGGGVFANSSSGSIKMEDGEITGNTATNYGGGVYSNATFEMTDGNITGNTAGSSGGGVCAANSFTMTDGSISSNTAGSYGGGVYSSATFEMTDGSITGNKAGSFGGGVYMYSGTFTMKKGTISYNNATSNGGGVYNNNSGTFTMEDGNISNNTTSSDSNNAIGGGVYNAGTFTMEDGNISNNTASSNSKSAGGGGVYNSGTFTMKNGHIDGNTASSGTSASGGGVYNNSGTFTMEDGNITENTASCNSSNATPCGGGVFNAGTFTMKNGHIDGNTASSPSYRAYCGGVYNAGTFTMKNGHIDGNTASSPSSRALCGGLYVNGTATMEGGTISNNKAIGATDALGAGVYVAGSKTFTMKNGEISGNEAQSESGAANGGGAYVKGTFTMKNGEISGNTADYGGGINAIAGSTVNLTAETEKTVSITGNTAEKAEGGVIAKGALYLSGKVIIKDNICKAAAYPANLAVAAPISIDGALTDSDIHVTLVNGETDEHNTGVLTSGFTTNNPGAKLGDFFIYDGPGTNKMILNDSGELEVVARSNVYWYADEDGEEVEVESESKGEAASTDSEWNTAWVLVTGNVKIENPIMLSNDVNLILADGASLEITNTIIGGEYTLTVYAQTNGTGKLTANSETTGYSTAYGMVGSVTVNGGNVKLSGKAESYDGYGVKDGNVTVNGGSVEISGTGAAQSYTGYGVAIGNVTVNGGTAKISGSGGSGFGVMGESITVTGEGELTLYGNTEATNVESGKISAAIKTSMDGVNWSDWDGKTDLSTFKYLKLTPKQHTHTLNKVEAKDATCTEDGISTTYYVCEGEGSCGKYFSDENGENEISAETAQSYTIGKMGHNFTGNYINYEGNKWAKKCSRCDTYETENALTGVAVPTAKTNLVYNGDTQTGVEEDTGYTLTGNTATDAGTYTAIATLENGYIWEDGTTTPKEIPWEIISEAAWHLAEQYCDSNEGKGYAMGRQGKLISGNVPSEEIGRTIIPLTQKQLEDIGAAVILLGNDGETEIEVTLDCAYTYFYQKDKSGKVTKITAESMGYAAFLIIDNNGNGGTINGYGYYRLYNDTLDNFMFDCLFVKPETK